MKGRVGLVVPVRPCLCELNSRTTDDLSLGSKCPQSQECQVISENIRRERLRETHAASEIGLARARPESLGLRTELFRVVNLTKFVQIVVAKKWIKRLQGFFEIFSWNEGLITRCTGDSTIAKLFSGRTSNAGLTRRS